MNKYYVIIGSSAAGMACASKLRDLDPSASIICVTAEQEMPYNRCLLADFLAERKVEADVRTRASSFFTEKNIDLRLASPVVELEPAQQTITLRSGEKLAYDKLFLGMGKSAFVPPISGILASGVFPFFDFSDARFVDQYIKNHSVKQVVVIGAGLTGLECADALQERGLTVSVLERSDRLLNNLIDQQGAQFIEQLMQKHGINLYKNATVVEILQQAGKACGVVLADGNIIPAELIIFATGGRTNTSLAVQGGLSLVGHGVRVDTHMQTSNQLIYAGGDLCMVNDLLTNLPIQSCLWPDAVQQGMVAAHGMVGIEKKYAGVLLVSVSHFFGVSFAASGMINQPIHVQKLVKQEQDFYHSFAMHDGALQSFVMIGNVSNLGMLRKALSRPIV